MPEGIWQDETRGGRRARRNSVRQTGYSIASRPGTRCEAHLPSMWRYGSDVVSERVGALR